MPRDHFFQTGGTLPDDAECYVERDADTELLDSIEAGELCLVLAARQTGKSSLMVHTWAKLRNRGVRAGILDLQILGSEQQETHWFGDVAYQIERELGLETDSSAWWQEHRALGAPQRFMTFIEDVVLTEIEGSVVLFFDEVDSVLRLPFSDDFFTTLRALHNARSTRPDLRRLTLVLAGTTTPSAFVKDRTRTPFNVGHSIDLRDFEADKTAAFGTILGDGCEPLVDRIFYWTRGQPLLVQILTSRAYEWTPTERTPERLDREVEESFLEKRVEQDTHLKFIRDYLLASVPRRAVLKTYRRVLEGQEVEADDRSPVHEQLKLAGVVRQEDRKLRKRNRIYARIFNRDWARANTPRDTARWAASGLVAVLVLGLLWTQLLRPGLVPAFPQVDSIVKYTADPSVEIELALTGTEVGQAFVTDASGIEREVPIPENRIIRTALGGLPEGESTRYVRLVAGWRSEERVIPVDVRYYPRWEIRQFPRSRHANYVYSVAFSPDGRALASASADHTVKFWDVESGEEIRTLAGHADSVTSVAFSPDGRILASGSRDETVKFWDVERGEEMRKLELPGSGVTSVAFSPDGKSLAARDEWKVMLWDVASGEEITSIWGLWGESGGVAFSVDGKILAAGRGGSVMLWDLASGEEIRTLAGQSDSITSIAFSIDGKILAAGSTNRTVTLWDVASGEEIRTLTGHPGLDLDVEFSSDGRTLAVSSSNEVKLWDIGSGEEIRTLDVHARVEQCISLSPDGRTLASGSHGRTVKLWDVEGGKEIRSFGGHAGEVQGVVFSIDGKTLTSAGSDWALKVWDVASGKLIRTAAGYGGLASSPALSIDGKSIAWGSWDRTVKLWDVASGNEIRTLAEHAGIVSCVSFTIDGRTIASGSMDGTVKLWDIASGEEIRTLAGHTGDVTSVAFSIDGKTLASGGEDGSIKLWDIQSGGEIHALAGHAWSVLVVSFSTDGKTLASGSEDGTVKLWDVETGEEIRTLPGQLIPVWSVAFSPDGRTLASGSKEDTVKLWDVESGEEIRTLQGHTGSVWSVAFSPDGRTLASGSADGTVKLWWVQREDRSGDR